MRKSTIVGVDAACAVLAVPAAANAAHISVEGNQLCVFDNFPEEQIRHNVEVFKPAPNQWRVISQPGPGIHRGTVEDLSEGPERGFAC